MTTRNVSAISNRKTIPPQFKESMSYKSWRNRVQMWQLVASILKKEQAILIILASLDNNAKAEKAVSEFTAAELNTDKGMELLISKLDSIFQGEAIVEAYDTCSKFTNYSRQENSDINDYVIEFEHLYKKMRNFEMKLPDPVFAFKLLDGASISDEERKLALALGKDMKFEDMKSALKRIFSRSITTIHIQKQSLNIKKLSVLKANQKTQNY